MNYDQAVVEFLSSPENFVTALEIAKRVDEVRNVLVLRFWREYDNQLGLRLQTAGCTDRWRVALSPEAKLLDDWASCWLAYRSPNSKAMHLQVMLESAQRSWNSRIYYGLHWSRDIRDPREPAVLGEIMPKVQQLGYEGPKSVTWPLYIELGHRLREDEFLLRFAAEPTQVVSEICDTVWRFFEQLREPLEGANEALGAL